eukprot:scaffold113128_cov54-Phaeocystis_antarctica.AAC.1
MMGPPCRTDQPPACRTYPERRAPLYVRTPSAPRTVAPLRSCAASPARGRSCCSSTRTSCLATPRA